MKKILCFAFFLYFLIAPMTHHPDNKLVLFWAGQENGAVWDIWEYGAQNFSKSSQFNYPPAHFYLDKLQYFVAIPIGGEGFHEWLATPNNTDPDQYLLPRYSFAQKFLLILITVGAGWLVYSISRRSNNSESNSKLAAILFLFNPITLYSVPIMGQNDILAIVFFLMGWYLLMSEKSIYTKLSSSILFGISISVKMFPIIWLPFLLFFHNKISLKSKITIFILSITTYFVTLLPFIRNPVFQEAVFGQDLLGRIFIAKISLGFSNSVLIVPTLLMMLVFGLGYTFFRVSQNNQVAESLRRRSIIFQSYSIMAVSGIMLSFSHYHPQWFLWIIPFWSIWMVSLERKMFVNMLIISIFAVLAWLLTIILFNDSYLFFGLFVPINPDLANLPVIRQFMELRNIDYTFFNDLARTWLAGLALLFVALAFNKEFFNYKQTKTLINYKAIDLFRIEKLFKNKKASTLSIFSVFIIGISLLTLILNFSPGPVSGPTPTHTSFIPIENEVISEIKSSYSNLNRVDINFRNVGLLNKDNHLIEIIDDENTIYSQEISGFNSGDPGIIRFDFPIVYASENRTFDFKITRLTSESEIPLMIGVSDEKSFISAKTYHQFNKNMRYVTEVTIDKMSDIFLQLWFLYLILPILLWLSL
jgi:hypothetical protein